MKHTEYNLQKQVCQYINIQYPKVLYMSDTIAAVKLSILQAVRNKAIQKEQFKCPDLIIFHPMKHYHGLFIELKIESPYKIDGITLKKNLHIEGQVATIEKLRELGYKAEMAWSFDMAKSIIDNYLK